MARKAKKQELGSMIAISDAINKVVADREAAKIPEAFAKPTAKPKVRRLPGKYSQVDLKGTGAMPEWDDMHLIGAEEHRKRWEQGKKFYYYHHSIKELRPFIVELFGPKWTKEQHRAFDSVKDCWVLPQLGAMCKMILDGARWPEGSKEWAEKEINMIMNRGASNLAVVEEKIEEPKKVVKVVDISDIRADIIGDIEEMEDGLIRTRKVPAVNFLNWLRQRNVPQNIVDDIADFYAERLAELLEARDGKDKQLKEGYAHYKKKDWDSWIKWYNQLLTDLEAFKRAKPTVKKVRQVKPPSPAKLVKRLKFQKKDDDLKLESIDPTEVISAKQVWIYNTKTRKLGVYHASEMDQQLTVKGSTIIGWDPKTSVAKTLRKPKEQLAEFGNASKIQLRTFLDKIKTTAVNLNGRINDQTILLKAYK